LWGRLADKAILRPKTVVIIGVIAFGALGLGLIGYKSSGFGNQAPPAGSDSAKGQAALAKHYPAANQEPDLLIMRFPSSVWANLDGVKSAQDKIPTSPAFSAVSGPFNANGFNLSVDQLQSLQSDPSSSAAKAVSQFIGKDGKTVQFYATLSAGSTGSPEAMRA